MNIQNTITALQTDTNRVQYDQNRENLGTGKLDKNAFLQLLMAQLQNQDPLKPLDNTEFISQQAQFTQIEKFDELIATMDSSSLISQSASLVGKNVEVTQDNGDTKVGIVSSARIGDGTAGVVIDDTVYGLNQVTRIFANPQTAGGGSNDTP